MAAKKASGATEVFRGFGSQALPFLQALRENNDRDWFAANKSIFLEECDAPFRELVGAVGGRLAAMGSPLAPVAKSPVMRIYRDVRFSNDKSPYKTNLGAALFRDGDKARPGIFYLHIQPAASFVAAGFYHPEAPTLKLLREAIAHDPAGFARMIETLETSGLAMTSGEPLTRMPKGWEALAESPVADFLKFRSFVVSQPMLDQDLERRDLADTIARFAQEVSPFLEFFWSKLVE